ncbi:cDNA FLJ33690 fis, clone BRAWH2002967, highly similar to Mitogen-activated protein kinase 3, related [Neospora caninum Liverpool]|uniref:Mitogen-activated protein kinase 3, related n=1 Tax=Neospora caninum (strain Liverpool) TaxID=572307 RepID=F0VN88_NEOCL|nr:cDNA FLJ33690 fis, clone BRAWH2002967, highly similar to Mitogen-activated protein kinase 3, related [Neospora caninum Liverpool]CBZ55184.1 cDNA FLJ33690 fis, clone BRAWH2002967, highly similar to Mitogen-activated protein kinase 3, related [Neospora caninum Liverpool]CEL69911.1 TPA: Mitogen-activated protein kinase 3, related [Neospora caninum Liverpool]|eukprot:XP_003885212.1 cDNA FLJ33690 fis, clone BRAWH2002967, highly similar to Mitogen-activated protein kinase 3, related [Neospora caninum Liverpool]
MSHSTGAGSSQAASAKTHQSSNVGFSMRSASIASDSVPSEPGRCEAPPGVVAGTGTIFCEKTCKVKIDNETVWQVPTRLKFVKKVGSGAYGCVASFEDTSTSVSDDTTTGDGEKSRREPSSEGAGGDSGTNKRVAVKKIGDLFRDLIDAKRIYREIKILKELKHENIINLVEILDPLTPDFDDIYLVSDLMDTDLHRVIYSRQPLTAEHHQYFLYQLLLGLSFLHQADIIHRDLKPSNILVNLNCDIKICDFGLARGLNMNPSPSQNLFPGPPASQLSGPACMASQSSVVCTYSEACTGAGKWGDQKIAAAAGAGSTAATRLVRLAHQQGSGLSEQLPEMPAKTEEPNDDMELTDYVVTRWYRPPEILISPFCYSKPVDLWSVGCIFAELLGRRALFAGKDHFDQLRRIVRILGRPSTAEINKVATEGRGRHFNNTGKGTSNAKRKRSEAARRFIESLPNNDPYKLEDLFPDASKAALDLLSGLLAFDPAKRITVQEALRHEYFEGLHSVEDEPHVTTPVDWSFDNFVPTKRLLQNKVYQEIISYHPEIVLRDFHLLPSRGVHISPSSLPSCIRQPLAILQQQHLAASLSTGSRTVSRGSGSLPTVARAGAVLRNPLGGLSTSSPSTGALAVPAAMGHPGSAGLFLGEDRSLSAASTAPPDDQSEALGLEVCGPMARAASAPTVAVAGQLAGSGKGGYSGCTLKDSGCGAGSGSARRAAASCDHATSGSFGEMTPADASHSLSTFSSSVSPYPQVCSVQSLPLTSSLQGGLSFASPASSHLGVPPGSSVVSSGSGGSARALVSDAGGNAGALPVVSSPQRVCSASYSASFGTSTASFASLPGVLTSSTSSAPFARKGGDLGRETSGQQIGSGPLSGRHATTPETASVEATLPGPAGPSSSRGRSDIGASPRLPLAQSAHPYIHKFLAHQRDVSSRRSSALVCRASQQPLQHTSFRERGCSSAFSEVSGRSSSLPLTTAELLAAAQACGGCSASGEGLSSCLHPAFSVSDQAQSCAVSSSLLGLLPNPGEKGGDVGLATDLAFLRSSIPFGGRSASCVEGFDGGSSGFLADTSVALSPGDNACVAVAAAALNPFPQNDDRPGAPLSCASLLARTTAQGRGCIRSGVESTGTGSAFSASLEGETGSRAATSGREGGNGTNSAHGSRTTTRSSACTDEGAFFLGATGDSCQAQSLPGTSSAALLQQYQKELQQRQFAVHHTQLAQHKRHQDGGFGGESGEAVLNASENPMGMSVGLSFATPGGDRGAETAMDIDVCRGTDAARPPPRVTYSLSEQQLLLLRQQQLQVQQQL